ncbi:MAG: hypothetical protein IJ222_00985 [Bacteroidales bacterium]|nr:hypothetical protein [Bacteroidales bacterium]
MKKSLAVLAAFVLPSFLLFSQEADEPGSGAELTVIPRIDLGLPANLGNSSIYSLFEGNISDNLSFSVSNHWASFSSDFKSFDTDAITDLYKYTWRSDWTNWCDWAYLEYGAGDFAFRIGKDMIYAGGIEFDAYDYDVHLPLMSGLWHNLSCYQWGGAIDWSPSESTLFSAQVATSPYGERPFGSGLYTYGLKWVGEEGPVNNIWQYSAIDTGDGFFHLISLGQTVSLSDALSITLDWRNAVCDPDELLLKGSTADLSLLWAPSESLELEVKGGWENRKDDDSFLYGCSANWYPEKFGRSLRIHASLAHNDLFEDSFYATVGVMYYLNLHIGR